MSISALQQFLDLIPDAIHYEVTIKREYISFRFHYDSCVSLKSYSREQIAKAYWDRTMHDIIAADIRKTIRQVTGGEIE